MSVTYVLSKLRGLLFLGVLFISGLLSSVELIASELQFVQNLLNQRDEQGAAIIHRELEILEVYVNSNLDSHYEKLPSTLKSEYSQPTQNEVDAIFAILLESVLPSYEEDWTAPQIISSVLGALIQNSAAEHTGQNINMLSITRSQLAPQHRTLTELLLTYFMEKYAEDYELGFNRATTNNLHPLASRAGNILFEQILSQPKITLTDMRPFFNDIGFFTYEEKFRQFRARTQTALQKFRSGEPVITILLEKPVVRLAIPPEHMASSIFSASTCSRHEVARKEAARDMRMRLAKKQQQKFVTERANTIYHDLNYFHHQASLIWSLINEQKVSLEEISDEFLAEQETRSLRALEEEFNDAPKSDQRKKKNAAKKSKKEPKKKLISENEQEETETQKHATKTKETPNPFSQTSFVLAQNLQSLEKTNGKKIQLLPRITRWKSATSESRFSENFPGYEVLTHEEFAYQIARHSAGPFAILLLGEGAKSFGFRHAYQDGSSSIVELKLNATMTYNNREETGLITIAAVKTKSNYLVFHAMFETTDRTNLLTQLKSKTKREEDGADNTWQSSGPCPIQVSDDGNLTLQYDNVQFTIFRIKPI